MDGGKSDAQDGLTALMRAAANGHAECMRLLLDAGTDKEAKNNVRFSVALSERPARLSLSILFPCRILNVCRSFPTRTH